LTPGWWNKAPVQTRRGHHPETKRSIGFILDWQTLVKVVELIHLSDGKATPPPLNLDLVYLIQIDYLKMFVR
jgi:hypothetical protein